MNVPIGNPEGQNQPGEGMVNFLLTASAIKAEKELLEAGFSARMVVPPPEMDDACNLGLVIDLARKTEIENLLREKGIRYCGILPFTANM